MRGARSDEIHPNQGVENASGSWSRSADSVAGGWKVRRVYKYAMPVTDVHNVELPEGAEILTVQSQHDEPHMWALVDPDAPMATRTFLLLGTGHSSEDDLSRDDYIGTYQLRDGGLVFHLFELGGGM